MTATPHQRAELLAIMAQAEAESLRMLADGVQFTELSPTAEQMYAHLTRDKLDGLDIHCEGGGWFADILLKDMPPYMCRCFGTPNHLPLPDEKTARTKAVRLLATTLFMIYNKSESKKPAPEGRPFQFFNLWVNIPVSVLTRAAAARKALKAGEYDFSENAVLQRLDQAKQYYFGAAKLTPELFNALPSEDQAMILTLCTIATLATGRIRHPPTGAFESIKCPRCGMVSYNETDIKTKYCGACHKFHDDP